MSRIQNKRTINKVAARRNIFVTGVPRGGTTVLGRMIAFSPEVNYVWEPFNLKYRNGVPDYYPYIGKETSDQKKTAYDQLITDTIALKNFDPVIEINPQDSVLKRIGKKCGINRTTFLWYTWPQIKNIFCNPRVTLFKDPIGIFLTEYIVKEFDFKVVAAIRHPAAVASSRRNLQWHFDFDWWREQEDFYLGYFKKIDTRLKKYDLDFITEVSFHWLTCYSFLQQLQELYPEQVMIVRHEDLCEEPVRLLGKIYDYLGLELNKKLVDKMINITTGEKLEKSTLTLAKLERRDAKNLIFKWKSEFSQQELDRIKEITSGISSIYYNEIGFWQI